MDQRGFRERPIQTLDWLHTKLMGSFERCFPSFSLINVYKEDVDKEVLCLIVAIINSHDSNPKFLSEIIALMGSMRPIDWVKGFKYEYAFAGRDTNEIVTDRTTLGAITSRLRRLGELYNDFNSIEDAIVIYGVNNPQSVLYTLIFDKENKQADYIDHIGINTALLWLTSTYLSVGFGLWKRISQKDFMPPIDKDIRHRFCIEMSIDKKSPKISTLLKSLLLKLDKQQPYKFIPLFKMKRWSTLVSDMGYTYTGNLLATKLYHYKYDKKKYSSEKNIQESIFNVL